jgi:hypothetical protein
MFILEELKKIQENSYVIITFYDDDLILASNGF